jgi:hypothetical protein
MRHLTTEILIQLAEGRLSPESTAYADRHLDTCATCFAEASEWSSVLDSLTLSVLENPPEYATRNCFAMYRIAKPVSSLRELLATLVFDSSLASATVGVRSAVVSRQIIFRANDVDCHLNISGQPRVMLGQMLRRGTGHFLSGVPVHLLQGDRLIEATITDDLGEFRFGTVPSGDLRIHADLQSHRMVGDFTVKVEEIN